MHCYQSSHNWKVLISHTPGLVMLLSAGKMLLSFLPMMASIMLSDTAVLPQFGRHGLEKKQH